MTDPDLDAALVAADVIERKVRRHVLTTQGAFELARGQNTYRRAVALRKAIEEWIFTRSQGPRQG